MFWSFNNDMAKAVKLKANVEPLPKPKKKMYTSPWTKEIISVDLVDKRHIVVRGRRLKHGAENHHFNTDFKYFSYFIFKLH